MTLAFAPERIEQWSLGRLQPYAKNAKLHGPDQVATQSSTATVVASSRCAPRGVMDQRRTPPDSSIEAHPADSDIGSKGAADGDDAKTPQTRQVERHLDPMRFEIGKRQLDRPPRRRRREGCAIGLPGANDIGGTEVEIVPLAIAKDLDLDPCPSAGVDATAAGCQIESDLDETAIVLERYLALHSKCQPTRNRLTAHSPRGHTPHHAVGDQLPTRTDRRFWMCPIYRVDDLGRVRHGVAPCGRHRQSAHRSCKHCAATYAYSLGSHHSTLNACPIKGKLSLMKQSRRMSLCEAIANVAVGYRVAVVTQILIFPVFGLHTTLAQNLKMGAVFTVVSIARSFALRRLFEAIRVGRQ